MDVLTCLERFNPHQFPLKHGTNCPQSRSSTSIIILSWPTVALHPAFSCRKRMFLWQWSTRPSWHTYTHTALIFPWVKYSITKTRGNRGRLKDKRAAGWVGGVTERGGDIFRARHGASAALPLVLFSRTWMMAVINKCCRQINHGGFSVCSASLHTFMLQLKLRCN